VTDEPRNAPRGRRGLGALRDWRRWSVRRLVNAVDPSLGEHEHAYRQHFLTADADQTILGMALLTAPMLLFTARDYLVIGHNVTFGLQALMRIFYVWFSVAVARRLRSAPDARTFDGLLSRWVLGGSCVVIAGTLSRPPDYVQPLAMWVLVALTAYLVMPNQLGHRMLIALVFGGSPILMLVMGLRTFDAVASNVIWTTIVLTNCVGVVASTHCSRLRRRQFMVRAELERTRDALQVMATTDELTGLLNRRRFLEVAEQELKRSRRYGRPLSIIGLDLDHFKDVNDRLGHAAGDTVLRTLGQVLRDEGRRQDIAGRLGGEEFAIVLPETSIDDAVALSERVRNRLGATRVVANGAALTVTASFGVAEITSTDGSVEDALGRADQALYRAKRAGRDRVEAA
jgi:diguanylate cyclase (GGDEF)-like protein